MKYWVSSNYKILPYIHICIECMIYDLLLNWINTAATMDIRTNSKTATAITTGILKAENTTESALKTTKKAFAKKYKIFFIFSIQVIMQSYRDNCLFVVVRIVDVGSSFVDDLTSLMVTSL